MLMPRGQRSWSPPTSHMRVTGSDVRPSLCCPPMSHAPLSLLSNKTRGPAPVRRAAAGPAADWQRRSTSPATLAVVYAGSGRHGGWPPFGRHRSRRPRRAGLGQGAHTAPQVTVHTLVARHSDGVRDFDARLFDHVRAGRDVRVGGGGGDGHAAECEGQTGEDTGDTSRRVHGRHLLSGAGRGFADSKRRAADAPSVRPWPRAPGPVGSAGLPLLSSTLEQPAAARTLSEGTAPSMAAAEAGFADQAHLTRWFTRTYGVTPATYRSTLHSESVPQQSAGCGHPGSNLDWRSVESPQFGRYAPWLSEGTSDAAVRRRRPITASVPTPESTERTAEGSHVFAARIAVKGWDPAAVGEHGKEPEPYELSERGRRAAERSRCRPSPRWARTRTPGRRATVRRRRARSWSAARWHRPREPGRRSA